MIDQSSPKKFTHLHTLDSKPELNRKREIKYDN